MLKMLPYGDSHDVRESGNEDLKRKKVLKKEKCMSVIISV